jgi:hypothetical protein
MCGDRSGPRAGRENEMGFASIPTVRSRAAIALTIG